MTHLGHVGSGLSERMRRELAAKLSEIQRDDSPFSATVREPSHQGRAGWLRDWWVLSNTANSLAGCGIPTGKRWFRLSDPKEAAAPTRSPV